MKEKNTGEMRKDVLTQRWVILAPDRARRPTEMEGQRSEAGELPEKDGNCPFCIGNEHMTPPVIFRLPTSSDDGWQTRTVPNKYPVLRPAAEVAGGNRGIYRVATNYGRHEVVIETPFHNRDIPFMRPGEVESVIETYARRYSALYRADEAIETVIVFRNHGARAGTSLRHPHSQIVATALVPESVAHRQKVAAEYYEQNGRCALCDVLEYERDEGTRVISENDSFLSFVPFAAEVPCEVWIVPKQHCADFGLIAQREQEALAFALQEVLQRLHGALQDPDYNYVIRSGSRQDTMVPHLHWYLQIQPRLTTPAGFEIGTGMRINHSMPEDDAELLREQ